jgi:putative cell wall-binding protein
MKHNTKLHRWASAFVVAVVAVVGLALAPPANAAPEVDVARIAGNDRFETAVAVAKAGYASGAQRVLVANGRTFPDALAGAALAGAADAPLLLTERDSVPTATSNGIRDLGAQTVYVLGGRATITPAAEATLAEGGRRVIRVAGEDRYETAAEIARVLTTNRVASLGGRRTAIIATGLDFADALAGGPLAAAGDGTGVHPILLVNQAVPEATEAAIRELNIQQVVILGGTAAVSDQVERRLEALTGADAVRIAGRDRYATAVAVARAAAERFDFGDDEVLLANGCVFADALAGGPLGAIRSAPIVLTEAASLPVPTRGYLESESATIETITVLGGTAAVSDQVAAAAKAAAEADPRPRNETIEVTPFTSEEVANGSTREYTATGLGTTPVDIVLVPCANVTTSGGETRFANANTNGIADGTAQTGSAPDLAAVADARIASVNGTARQPGDPTVGNDDYANNVAPRDGSVTFTVAGPAASSTATVCVVPVVFVDANGDNALNGTTANPTVLNESFGTGGRVTFSASGAPAGQFAAHEVRSTDKAADRFTACRAGSTPFSPEECRVFRYDANDTFQLDSQPITMAQFESRLSIGDSVRGTYATEASGVSTFNLTDAAPLPPTNPSATASGTIVRVSFTDSPTPTVDLYRLYRATRATGATTCPDFNGAGRADYGRVPPQASTIEGQPNQGETADTGNASSLPPAPAPTYTIADRTGAENTTYCYVLVSVDKEKPADADGDESAGTSPVTATTGTSQVIITDSRATSTDDNLNSGDVLRFTFDRPVTIANDATVQDNTGVRVRGGQPGGSNEDLTCGPSGTRATCTYDEGTRTLSMTITGTTSQQYPLTLVAVYGLPGQEVDVTNSDRTIQRVT